MPALAPPPRWVAGPEKPGQGLDDLLPRFLADWTDRLPKAAIAAATELPNRLDAARATLARAPTTLVHADLHLDNVLFLDDGAPVILDWPSACRGPAAVDFARLLVEGMTFTARRARQEALTRRYLVALASRGVRYDVDRLRADVSAVATALYAAAIRWAAGPHAVNPDVPRVARIVESLVRNAADAAIDPACVAA
jgi:aminoglycoside phosphotransferase (APT) family kinase protein